MLKFHWHSSVNHQKDGLKVQEAACHFLQYFLGFYDDSNLPAIRMLFIFWAEPGQLRPKSRIGSA